MFTIVGLPLGFALFLVWLVFVYLGTSVAGLYLGSALWPLLEKLTKKKLSSFKSPATLPTLKYLLGGTLIFIVSFVPVLGNLVSALSLVFGFGLLTTTLFTLRTKKSTPKKS